MKMWEKLVSATALLVIAGGIKYAVARESLRTMNLDREYQRINSQFYGGALLSVKVQWGVFTEEGWSGATYDNGSGQPGLIVIDLETVTTRDELREVLRHEMAHVCSWDEEEDHGPRWQGCLGQSR